MRIPVIEHEERTAAFLRCGLSAAVGTVHVVHDGFETVRGTGFKVRARG
ncbi:hypothetical protein [Streptomyces sp. NPDC056144]